MISDLFDKNTIFLEQQKGLENIQTLFVYFIIID
jgi:hypothetical protein